MENIERELHRGDEDPTPLAYSIETALGRIDTLGKAATLIAVTLDNSTRSAARERAHEAIGKAQRSDRNEADVKMATHLIEVACREAGIIKP